MRLWDHFVAPTIRDRLERLYHRTGFHPLDEWIGRQLISNQMNLMNPCLMNTDLYRQLGTTTWMCAHATIRLNQGFNVHIITELAPDRIPTLVCDLMQSENHIMTWQGSDQRLVFSNGATLFVTRQFDQGTPQDRLVYFEADWYNRIIRRAKGPYSMIREIRYEYGGHWNVYAEESELIGEITTAAAFKLAFKPGAGIPLLTGAKIFLEPDFWEGDKYTIIPDDPDYKGRLGGFDEIRTVDPVGVRPSAGSPHEAPRSRQELLRRLLPVSPPPSRHPGTTPGLNPSGQTPQGHSDPSSGEIPSSVPGQ